MKFSFTNLSGTTAECEIGYGVAIATSKRIRELATEEFRSRAHLYAETLKSDALKAEEFSLLDDYKTKSVPNDEDVERFLLADLEGQLFALKHASGMSQGDAEAVFNTLSDTKRWELVDCLRSFLWGKSLMEANRKLRLAEEEEVLKKGEDGAQESRELMNTARYAESVLGHKEAVNAIFDLAKRAEEKKAKDAPLPNQMDLLATLEEKPVEVVEASSGM